MAAVQIPDLGGATMDSIDVGDFITAKFMKSPAETKQIFDNVPDFKFREDDVLLCAYPKTGTHFAFEILVSLLAKSANPDAPHKLSTMLECESPENIDKIPSPRVINSHYPYRFLPVKDMRAKQIKTVLCCRNPKDTAVSYYNHMHGIKHYSYDGKWVDWLPVYLQGKLEFGKYTDYLMEWEKAIKEEGLGFPLHVMYYEDIKLNANDELNKLAKFLSVELDDALAQDIIKACSFESMASKEISEDIVNNFFKQDFRVFRKGEIGDWKNWFTDDQTTLFEDIWKQEMKHSSIFEFIYTDPRI